MSSRPKPEIQTNPLRARFRVDADPVAPAAAPEPAGEVTQPARKARGDGSAASTTASGAAGEVATHVAAPLAEQQASTVATSRLRRQRSNPWRDLVQTGIRLPRFEREYLRTLSALSGGEVQVQALVAEAVALLAASRGEAELLEEAWTEAGGVPGQMDRFMPR